MAISHGRLSAIEQGTINSVRACNDDRAAHFLTFHHRARARVYVLEGKMISLVPRGKAAETMREHVVARLSSSVVNIRQNF